MTFSKRDSALGEQCGSVAKIVKGTNAKFANLPQFSQSYHSPTAIPRILKEEKSSLRDFALAKSWQSTSSKNAKTQKVDSRIFTQATQSVETLKNAGAESAFDTKVAGGRIFDEKRNKFKNTTGF